MCSCCSWLAGEWCWVWAMEGIGGLWCWDSWMGGLCCWLWDMGLGGLWWDCAICMGLWLLWWPISWLLDADDDAEWYCLSD